MKSSQEKIGQLSVKMEQGTGPCLKLPRSSVPFPSELASAQREHSRLMKLWGILWSLCTSSWERLSNLPVFSVTGGCEKQHWCVLLQLPNPSQRAFCRGWQNGWVLWGVWWGQAVLTVPSWLQVSPAWVSSVPWPSSHCIPAGLVWWPVSIVLQLQKFSGPKFSSSQVPPLILSARQGVDLFSLKKTDFWYFGICLGWDCCSFGVFWLFDSLECV